MTSSVRRPRVRTASGRPDQETYLVVRARVALSLRGSSPTVREGVLSARNTAPPAAMRDFDDNDFPFAYLITFRCYGTWLHGEARGSMDRKHNTYGMPTIAPNPQLERSDAGQRQHEPITLNAKQRRVVERAAKNVCDYRGFVLRAISVRTNHVHIVVSAMRKPEPVLNAFKCYATRDLRQAGLLSERIKPWARHGSTIYLWKEQDVAKAVEYVLLGQGEELFKLGE